MSNTNDQDQGACLYKPGAKVGSSDDRRASRASKAKYQRPEDNSPGLKQARFGTVPEVVVRAIPTKEDKETYLYSDEEEGGRRQPIKQASRQSKKQGLNLMPQDIFDQKIELQRQKIKGRKMMKELIQKDFEESGIRWDALAPVDTDMKINVISKDNPMENKSCVRKNRKTQEEPKQARFAAEPEVKIRAIPKGDDEYLFSSDEEETKTPHPRSHTQAPRIKQGSSKQASKKPTVHKQARFGREPNVNIHAIPKSEEQYLFSDDEDEQMMTPRGRPIRREDIMSQEVFDQKMNFRKQQLAGRNMMKNLIQQDYEESGIRWDTLKPLDVDMKINVISKDNPTMCKTCIRQGINTQSKPKTARFAAEPEVSVCAIPKGDDQYLFSDDEEESNYGEAEQDNNEEDENESSESSESGAICMANYDVKMAPAMAQEPEEMPEQYVSNYLYVGALQHGPNPTRRVPVPPNTPSTRLRQHG